MIELLRTFTRRRHAVAALTALLLALPVALPSLAAGTPAPAATVVHARVARPGTYVVLVSFPAVPASGSATVTVGAHHQATVPLYANSPSSVEFFVRLTGVSFQVRTVTTGAPLKFTVATARGSAPTTTETQNAGLPGAPTDPWHTAKVFTAPAAGPYNTLVWSDEFNGAAGSAPNAANWLLDKGGSCGAGTLSTNTQSTANASLDGQGGLEITALRDASGSYTSAQLDTAYKYSFKYGRVEARIRQPAGAGLCSAFWLLGDAGSPASPTCWPGCGEIDIAEMIGQIPTQVDAFMHGPYPNDPDANSQQWGAEVNSPVPLTAGYHTYAVIWRPNSLTWTIDGVAYAHMTPSDLPKGAQWVYNQHSAHIVLDLEVGGWPGPPAAATAFPATMHVDWVRVYQ